MVKKALPKKQKPTKAKAPRKIVMFGSRYDLGNLPEKIAAKFKEMHEADPNFVVIVGKAPGVDTICEFYANKYGHKIDPNPAKWKDKNGKFNIAAGHNRNTVMVKKATEGVGFWNKTSTGTMDTYKKLKKAGKPVELIKKD